MAQLARTVRHLHRRLDAASSLRPSRQIDQLFRRLVDIASRTPSQHASAVLADPVVQALRPRLIELCARGEHELELAWAWRIATSRVPHIQLARFPYLANYQLLTGLEYAALMRCSDRPPHRTLFVGAGPLPLSPLLLAQRLGTPVDSIDIDPSAVHLAQGVANRLGAPHVEFRQRELTTCDDLTGYDLVIVAALVGLTSDQKRHYLQHLHEAMAPGALLLARSADGLKTLLYPAIDLADLAPYELLSVTHPTGSVINSILLARKRGVSSPSRSLRGIGDR